MKTGRFTAFRSDEYLIQTDIYNGPLDLLLELIERAELDITLLSLAQVTDQFLATVRAMETNRPDDVSAFIVIAARLIQLKSAALLPKAPVEIGEIDEASDDDLATQLIRYRRYKQLAETLSYIEDTGFRSYERLAAPNLGIEPPLDLQDLTLEKMASVASLLFRKKAQPKAVSTVLAGPRLTIKDRILTILDRLKRGKTFLFSSLFRGNRPGNEPINDENTPVESKVTVVVTFLAMLELMKRRVIQISQPERFGDIEIEPLDAEFGADEFKSEFSE